MSAKDTMPEKMLNCRFRRQNPKVKLICFPWAGGGAAFYANWGKHFPDSIEVHGVTLAGRETRYNEPVYKSLTKLVDDVTSAIHAECGETPFAFWGHSMGSLTAYEAVCTMKSRYNLQPVHMFLSGVSAPHSQKRKQTTFDIRKYTDDEFVEFLKTLGGTPADIIENREVMNVFLPSLRADYELVNEFSYDPPSQRCVLQCPVHVFDGEDDVPHDLKAWGDISTGPYKETKLDGGHFYLKDPGNTRILCHHITHALNQIKLK